MGGQLARGVFGRPRVTWLSEKTILGDPIRKRGRTCMNSTPKRKWRSSILAPMTLARRQKNRAVRLDDPAGRFLEEV